MKKLKDIGKSFRASLSKSDWRDEMRSWLNDLELLGSSRALEALTERYTEFANSQDSASDRMERLEFCRPNLSRRITDLQTDFIRRTAAELARDKGVLRSLDQLLSQAAAAYRSVLDAQNVSDEQRLVAAYRTSVYLAARIFLGFMSYRDPKPGHWKSLHQLYLLAEQGGFARTEIPEAAREQGGLADPSIENVYKRILIIDSGNPFRMLREEAAQAFTFLSKSVGHSHVEPVTEHALEKGSYYVVLTDDRGARRWDGMTPINVARTRLLQAGDLVKQLRTSAGIFTQQLKESTNQPWELRLRRDMALRLSRIWDPLPHRRHARLGADGQIELALGSGAVHHYLSGGARFDPAGVERMLRTVCDDESDFVPEDVWDTGSVAATSSGSDDSESGAWNWTAIELDEAGIEARSGAQSTDSSGDASFDTHRHQLENASHGGFEFTWNPEVALQTQVGDVAAYRLVDGGDWRLGSIRWLQISDDCTRLGTMHMTDEIRPVALKIVKNKVESFHRALLIGGNDPEAKGIQLLFGTGIASLGEQVWIIDPDFLVRAEITTQRTATPSFSTFEFKIESLCRPALHKK